MNMSRYIVRRIIAISVVILLAALSLALWRAQFDVAREERGAADEVRLFEYLYALENGPVADIDVNIESLRRINSSRNLRHVRFTLSDGDGRVLVAPSADEAPTLLQRAFAAIAPGMPAPQLDATAPWLLQRDDGRRFLASLSLSPASEQLEALDNLLGMLLVLLGYAAAILLALYWTLRRALAPMTPILAAIDRFQCNDLSHRLPALPFAETDAIGHALNHMATSLTTAQEQRRSLSLKLVSSQEDERTRLSRELHDEFGQRLTAMRADLSWLTRRTADQAPLQEVLQGMTAHCERLQQDIRELLSRLRPLEARASGFAASLEKLMADLVRSWNDRLGEQTRFTLYYAVGDASIPDDLALTLYRMTQEALTNSVRHSRATWAQVALATDGSTLSWSVEDDGTGIDDVGGGIQSGNGLAGMRERAWALGSDLQIEPARAVVERPGLRVAAAFVLLKHSASTLAT
ncbi:MAG TPA: histidine kinase [Rudaea sp.]|jgi:two-component system sensor histidine kinase UhpB